MSAQPLWKWANPGSLQKEVTQSDNGGLRKAQNVQNNSQIIDFYQT